MRFFALFLLTSSLFAQTPAPIRFEDATAKSGINFTHSFGAQRLGSLLESTGSGCAWFDYNNDGLTDLYVASGKPLEDGIHPYPLKQPPRLRRTIIYIATTVTALLPTSQIRLESPRTSTARQSLQLITTMTATSICS